MPRHHREAPDAGAWQARAACLDHDPEVFFPDPSDPAELALSVCAGCAVRLTCLRIALAAEEAHGVWGGTTETTRRRMLASGRAVDTNSTTGPAVAAGDGGGEAA